MITSPRLAAPALLAAIAAATIGIGLASAAPASAAPTFGGGGNCRCSTYGGGGFRGGGMQVRRDFPEGSLLDRIQDWFHPDDVALTAR